MRCQKTIPDRVSRVFKDAPDLKSEFNKFIPPERAHLLRDPEEVVDLKAGS
jgi:histone deacetylase complex regulatory component SIN3